MRRWRGGLEECGIVGWGKCRAGSDFPVAFFRGGGACAHGVKIVGSRNAAYPDACERRLSVF